MWRRGREGRRRKEGRRKERCGKAETKKWGSDARGAK